MPLSTYYPPTANPELNSIPFTRTVVGRGVAQSDASTVTVMWTNTSVPKKASIFKPNHFVLLCARPQPDGDISVIDLDVHVSPDKDNTPPSPTPTCRSADSSLDNSIATCASPVEDTSHVENGQCDLTPLPDGRNLGLDQVMSLLNNPPQINKSIPTGVKENVYTIIDNTDNVTRKDQGQRCRYYDDCGVWDSKSGSSPKTLYFKGPNGELTSVVLKNEKFCLYRSEKGKRIYREMDPQPPRDSILVLQKIFGSLKIDKSYKRRICVLGHLEGVKSDIPKVALVEYTETYPGSSCHGNSKCEKTYHRTPGHVLDKVAELGKHKKPNGVYGEMLLTTDSVRDMPRDKRQITNKLYNERRKERVLHGCPSYTSNFADQVLAVTEMVQKNDFVQALVHDKDKTPAIILYNDTVIKTMKQMCINAPVPTILGVDRTFNLGDFYVTATSFKHMHLLRRNTTDHPITFGPVFVHGSSTTKGYFSFFSRISSDLLDCNTENLLFGTDEEQALINAIKGAFPRSSLVSCIRHLRNNFVDFLKDKIGVEEKRRNLIVDSIFGADGIAYADDTIMFDLHTKVTRKMCCDLPLVLNRLEKHTLPRLKDNVVQPRIRLGLPKPWTNNNAESLNHVLKSAVNWKLQSLIEIIKEIQQLVEVAQEDSKRALFDMGNFVLAPDFKQYSLTLHAWEKMEKKQREKFVNDFIADKWRSRRTITSTNGAITVVRTPGQGKKPGQIKRKRAERTLSKTSTAKKLRFGK
jgi:hypothetical protein